jgi:hypothetical protein
MTDCKHDWHFVDGTSDLKCRRCGKETGTRPEDLYTMPLFQDDPLEKARQAELNACCDLLEGMHAATDGNHNYYLHAANELRKLRKSKP